MTHGCIATNVGPRLNARPPLVGEAQRSTLSRNIAAVAATAWALMLVGLLSSPEAAHAFRGDNQAHVVIDPHTEALSEEAQEFLKNYDTTLDQRWTAASIEALEDNKRFKKVLIGRFLPFAGRVVPIVAGAVTAYELCSGLVHQGCWLFERDDTDLQNHPDYSPVWQHVEFVGADGLPFGTPGGGPAWPSVPALALKRDIAIARRNQGPYWFNDTHYGPGNCIAYGPTDFDFSPHAVRTAENQFRCWISYQVWSGDYPATVFWKDATEDLIVRAPAPDDPAIPNAVPSNSQPGDNNWPRSIPQELTTRQRDAICWLLRPDLCDNPYTVPMPDCAGVTEQTCVDRVRDAGFTGTITPRTLSADDAVMEQDADRVTATSPATGAEISRDGDVTVYINPDTMPQMTAQETAIAEALQANNPGVITAQNKRVFLSFGGDAGVASLA